MLRADFFFFLRIILILTISIIFCRILCAKKKKNYQELYKYSPWRIFFLLFVRFSLDARQESRVQSELAFRFIERLFNKIVDLLYFFFFLFLSLSPFSFPLIDHRIISRQIKHLNGINESNEISRFPARKGTFIAQPRTFTELIV